MTIDNSNTIIMVSLLEMASDVLAIVVDMVQNHIETDIVTVSRRQISSSKITLPVECAVNDLL